MSFRRTHDAAIDHDLTRGELKAIGRGLRAKRSRSRRCANLLGQPMQRASEAIGKLAAALAKAQQLLENPEKGLSAVCADGVRPLRMEIDACRRAGVLSSAVDGSPVLASTSWILGRCRLCLAPAPAEPAQYSEARDE